MQVQATIVRRLCSSPELRYEVTRESPLPPSAGHAIFEQYLRAAPGEAENKLLETLLVEVVRPLVNRVVGRRFSSSRDTTPEDREDVCGDAMAAIVARLKLARPDDGAAAIGDFEAFAAGVATHIAGRFFMARTPQRSLLRNRLRYVLTTDGRFFIRQSEQGSWHCGLADSRPLTTILSDAQVEACRRTLAATRVTEGKLPELVIQILRMARGAMELSALTSLAADSLGIADRSEVLHELADTLQTAEPGALRQAEMKQRMRQLWREVCELPVQQRRALLLNLGSAGAGAPQATAWLIPDLGIATFRALAETLEMTAEDLASVWNDLPLPDNDIATRFGLERQQVINLRSAARQRLARRLPI